MSLLRKSFPTLNNMKHSILRHLPPEYPWKEQLICFSELDSTNDRLKQLAKQGAPHGTVLIADRQTGGHGRLGRSFHSPGGMGVYLSLLLRPNCRPQEIMHLTCAAAVAMCDAVEKAAGFRPGIKWTNDLVFEKRKLGGILTELGLSPRGMVEYAIIGIGINCCQQASDFPNNLQSMASSLSMVAGRSIDRARLAAAMVEALWAMDSRLFSHREALLGRYRRDCVTLGKEISILRGDTVSHGTALDIDSAGALLVRYPGGHTEAVNSGEVSIRGMYGYV